MKFPRSSGVLLHPTSLPGRFGIGDLGQAAYRFVDWLVSAGQSYWQVLPLNPTGYADSPYQALSAFAGNPLLIDLDALAGLGHLTKADLADVPPFPAERVDYGPVIRYKTTLLDRAFANFQAAQPADQAAAFAAFCAEHAGWLDDFALFTAIKEENELRPWGEWEEALKTRQPAALEVKAEALAGIILKQKYLQWIFFEQWLALKRYANNRGVRFIGDIPIFVALDSADVWANTPLFLFDADLNPTVVSGVPPDYFSKTGQLWGHPLYRWDVMKERGYTWWISRFRMAFLQADVVRIDHFRGFNDYWEVPASAPTAEIGQWLPGPGPDIFHTVTAALGDVAIIAEDLGDFTPEARAGVDELQETFRYPGMKIVQFGFGGGPDDHFLPHNFTRDWVAYTGTHDNDTVVGWYQNGASEQERDAARKYLGVSGQDIAWDLIRLTWSSVAGTAMTTAQDLLGLSSAARMNTPGTVGPPNWCWRLPPGALTAGLARRLIELTAIYGRLPRPAAPPPPPM